MYYVYDRKYMYMYLRIEKHYYYYKFKNKEEIKSIISIKFVFID